jgi:hypothetical protein
MAAPMVSKMTDAELQAIRDAGLIDDVKLAEITAFLAARRPAGWTAPAPVERAPATPRFDLTHVLWYAGALIIMGAMGLFTTTAFAAMGGWALFACGAAYALVFGFAGDFLWHRKDLRVPGGLLVTVAVSMVPMMIYGVQDALDLWKYAEGDPGSYKNFYPYVNGSWLYMELGAIAAAVVAVWRYPFPFILMVAAVALWFMSMDLAMWFTATPGAYDEFETRRMVSLWFGLALIIAAWVADILRRGGPDFTFWIHITGAWAFWGALSATSGGTELQKFGYCLINVLLIGFAVFVDRRVYAVVGAMGVATYLGYLAYDVFSDAILFSFALSAIGLLVIFLGLWLHRNYDRLAAAFDASLPPALKALRPSRAAS